MRYRALTAEYDYSFGQGQANFLINSPEAVGQLVLTRLRLLRGEWFLDKQEGTPYSTLILGTNTSGTYDAAIRAQILATQGVTGLVNYSSSLNTATRKLTITANVDTVYGSTAVQETLSL